MLNLLAQSDSAGPLDLLAGGMMMTVMCGIGIVFYVIMAMALTTIAKKLGKTDNLIWAWIPILNLMLLAELAEQQSWWGLLCLIPYVGAAVAIYLWWKVCERRGKPGWMSLGLIIPCVGFFVPLYVAYSD